MAYGKEPEEQLWALKRGAPRGWPRRPPPPKKKTQTKTPTNPPPQKTPPNFFGFLFIIFGNK